MMMMMMIIIIIIIIHVDPLLSYDYEKRPLPNNDRGISEYTAAVAE
jgi:hypothetical protein